jgi:acetaldehyde dehydrogenase/alcohol dehydrogenase
MEQKAFDMVDSVEALKAAIDRVRAAQRVFAAYTQEQVDRIFLAAATAANRARISLAKLAVEETGMGVVEDKVIKNHYASEYIYNAYRDTKTCGVIEEDKAYGMKKIAEPIGVVAAVIPPPHPTAIFKALICLKTRNGIISAPTRAKKPPSPRRRWYWMPLSGPARRRASSAGSTCLPGDDQHPDAGSGYYPGTGGPGMVKAAYSSGKPALGVGAGNVPPSSTTAPIWCWRSIPSTCPRPSTTA